MKSSLVTQITVSNIFLSKVSKLYLLTLPNPKPNMFVTSNSYNGNKVRIF